MRNRGFTLIEVLVASVVLVALLSALLPLFNQSGNATQRAINSNQRISIERNIYNSLKFINPYQTQKGDGVYAGLKFTWLAKPITPEITTRLDKLATDRDRMVRLYAITVEVTPQDKKSHPWQFHFEQLGWEI